MEENILKFEIIKETRGEYFVEYHPLGFPKNFFFSCLSIVFLKTKPIEEIKQIMLSETSAWLSRYPVPVMTTAFDETGSKINFSSNKDHLVGWVSEDKSTKHTSWNLDDLNAHSEKPFSNEILIDIFKDVPFERYSDLKKRIKEDLVIKQKKIKALKLLLIFWASLIPFIWLTIEFFGPEWIGYIVYAYATIQLLITGLKILGICKPNSNDLEKTEIQRKKDHYFYHCEKNPDAFLKLKIQNFDEEARNDIVEEYRRIKS